MNTHLPPPKIWDDFEDLCYELWKKILNDKEIKKHGRKGQKQHGVDIYGKDYYIESSKTYLDEWVGIQCKCKDVFLGHKVTKNELINEVNEALSFKPPLKKLILATTAPRDKSLQEEARLITEDHDRKDYFSVSIWSWEDIEDALMNYPDLCRKLYPKIYNSRHLNHHNNSITTKINLKSNHEETIANLFEADEFKDSINNELRYEIRDLMLEITSNSFHHGHAKNVSMEIERNKITIKEDGVPFNQLDDSLIDEKSYDNNGLKYIKSFSEKHKNISKSSYIRKEDKNIIIFDFFTEIAHIDPEKCILEPGNSDFISRTYAESEAKRIKINPQCDIYSFYVDRSRFNMSSLHVYIRTILARIPEGKRLNIIFSHNDDLLCKVRDNYKIHPNVTFSALNEIT